MWLRWCRGGSRSLSRRSGTSTPFGGRTIRGQSVDDRYRTDRDIDRVVEKRDERDIQSGSAAEPCVSETHRHRPSRPPSNNGSTSPGPPGAAPDAISKPSGMSASDSREHLGAGGAAFGWRGDLG